MATSNKIKKIIGNIIIESINNNNDKMIKLIHNHYMRIIRVIMYDCVELTDEYHYYIRTIKGTLRSEVIKHYKGDLLFNSDLDDILYYFTNNTENGLFEETEFNKRISDLIKRYQIKEKLLFYDTINMLCKLLKSTHVMVSTIFKPCQYLHHDFGMLTKSLTKSEDSKTSDLVKKFKDGNYKERLQGFKERFETIKKKRLW